MSQSESKSQDSPNGDGQFEELADEMEQVDADNSSDEQVPVGNLLDQLNHRGYGPLLFIPALLSVSPLGAIPGMSIFTGSLIELIAVQMLFRSSPWFPGWIRRRTVSRSRLNAALDKMRPWLRWLDWIIRERWLILVDGPMKWGFPFVISLVALLYFPMAIVPFGVLLPGAAATFLAAGLTARDGMFVSLGLLATTAAVYFSLSLAL
ncbi:MAG: exopolysaccharide biosynthesis protein [Planctomycetaceae bacterium]|nr:exopolysaccharide biosynthesis protein [Planctomycetaceae bacterium]MCB9950926.1 exopolysaccharide biosynthesis protein [Planctomycetaceae bacterium]